MERMIFWGATGQARVLREAMRGSGWSLVAVFDRNENIGSPFADVPIFYQRSGFEEWLRQSEFETIGFLVAIGGSRGKDRVEIQDYLESKGLKPLTCVHPTAFIAENTLIGAGSQVLAQTTVCVDASVGRGCIVNSGAVVDHDCSLADGVHIGPGASLAGCVEVGQYAMIGAGAVVLPRISIGEHAVVGAGAIVTRDVGPHETVVGNPAKLLRKT